jgi:hypothetical protein
MSVEQMHMYLVVSHDGVHRPKACFGSAHAGLAKKVQQKNMADLSSVVPVVAEMTSQVVPGPHRHALLLSR